MKQPDPTGPWLDPTHVLLCAKVDVLSIRSFAANLLPVHHKLYSHQKTKIHLVQDVGYVRAVVSSKYSLVGDNVKTTCCYGVMQ